MKILVVDDSSTVRLVLRRHLSEAGYEVVESRNGAEALEAWSRERPDLVTLDIDLGNMDGFQTLGRLQEMHARTASAEPLHAIFVTAHDTEAARRRARDLGARAFLPKPVSDKKLIETVDRILRQEDDAVRGVTALVAEDDAVARRLVTGVLEGTGMRVLANADGAAALACAEEHAGEIDIVLTDFNMPQMDGDEFCRRLRRRGWARDLPVIFLSAMDERKTVLKMFEAGATDYLAKPFYEEELLARIRAHLETRRLNRRLREQVEELTRLTQMQNEFLAITSHDLASPLMGISGYAELLLLEKGLDDRLREYARHILESADFLSDFVKNILGLARAQSREAALELQPQEPGPILQSCIRTLEQMARPKDVAIVYRDEREQPTQVRGDRSCLLRVFNNLISNAVKFTGSGGRVTVRLGGDGEEVRIAVEDTGVGIPPEAIPTLFERYRGLSREGTAGETSTGLGLSITRDLVERHGGTVAVRSEPGAGSTFAVTLPAAPRTPAQDEEDTASRSDA